MPLQSKRRHLAVTIRRLGSAATITRPDGTATENKYNKRSSEDVTYEHVADTVARQFYQRDSDEPTEGGVSGGRIDTDNPRIALPHDTPAQEDDRITFDDTGRTYVLDERVHRDTHAEFRVSLVQG